MALRKELAFKSLANKIRQRYEMEFNDEFLVPESEVKEYVDAPESVYQRYAKIYSGLEYKSGGHPDFDYLANPGNIGNTEEGVITAFFLDLRNFTKYCKFLSRKKVYVAKAATIEATIGICYLYEGHLHEIPGDGVLCFFGGKDAENLESGSLAVQAACDVMAVLEEEIIPEFNNEEAYPKIYPKIGLDFGEALWGAYGADPNYEVKATSFYVDIASKMMNKCTARQAAIGDNIKNLLEIDEEYTENLWKYKRELTVEGEKQEISYQTWRFNWRAFRNDMMDPSKDIAQLGILPFTHDVSGSKSKLGDAPLA